MKKLKTLEENNAQAWNVPDYTKPRLNGVACPKCGKELYDSNPMITLTSYPAQKTTHCECGYTGSRFV